VRWNRNSQELFYIGARNMLNAVSVNTTSNLTSGTPVALFQVRSRAQISSTDLYSYDVAPDGARFLVNSYVKPAYIRPLMVILNASAAAQK
jgi:tryptophanase